MVRCLSSLESYLRFCLVGLSLRCFLGGLLVILYMLLFRLYIGLLGLLVVNYLFFLLLVVQIVLLGFVSMLLDVLDKAMHCLLIVLLQVLLCF